MSDYNFLTLVNEVNRRLNEVELTSSNFSTVSGFYDMTKDSVNASIRHINHEEFGWPFNHIEEEDILTAGVIRYAYPPEAKHIDMDSFRLKRNSSLGIDTRKLSAVDYKDYLKNEIDYEYNDSTTVRGVPQYISLAPSNEIIIFPTPDKAYELVYEYYRNPVDLSLYDDVPTIPREFKHIIVDGALYYAYQFRGDNQSSQMSQAKFMEGIKYMRSLYINKYDYVRSTYIIPRSRFTRFGVV